MSISDSTLDSQGFQPGTFAPKPGRAPVSAMLRSQGAIEAKLFLRHGEQLLLSFVIPLISLVILHFQPIADAPIASIFPAMLAMAAMSSGFTGQAISLAFDRRYGALKRTGASGVPSWTIVMGKIIGVLCVSFLQLVMLGIAAYTLGWRVSVPGLLLGSAVFFLGVAMFTAFGLLMGGSLSSEIVLGVANLLWFVLIGIASVVMMRDTASPSLLVQLIPSVALADGLRSGFAGVVPWTQMLILSGYMVLGTAAASRWFRFN